MSQGRTGITNFVTMLSTTVWNSSSRLMMVLLRFQAAASPTRTERNRADMTGMICGMESLNTTSGRDFSPSAAVLMFRNGRIV